MSEPVFRRVHAHEVGDVWALVDMGLREIVAQCPTVPWNPADVRRALRREEAFLFVRDEGFVITQRCLCPISAEPYLNVWAIWFAPGCASAIREELVEWLDYTCRATRCEWWEGTSTREGWGRALEGVCDVAMVTWRRRP